MQKRVLAIHDISCVGKCSLTVALPVLSAVGVETSVIPTAILSTHTGGFTGYTYRDLTGDIMPIIDHWKTLNLNVDAIYTGYLGSFQQLEIMKKVFEKIRNEKTMIFIDPVMGDNGSLYTNFTKEFAAGMASLCSMADIITPNMTEAAFLLDEPFCKNGCTEEYVENILRRLTALGPKCAILSGVSFEKGKLGAASYRKDTDTFDYYFTDEIEGSYHGTGDVFASAVLGSLMNGMCLEDTLKAAVDFTVESISRTKAAGTDVRFGVDFEHSIPGFINAVSTYAPKE